jgi:hypothetical protein
MTHLEVALRNTLAERLAARHRRLGRAGSWLDDPEEELSSRARLDIAGARDRVRQKGKRASDGQTISELSFGFWRFLVTKKLTGLWPDLASGFSHAPDRQLGTVEGRIAHPAPSARDKRVVRRVPSPRGWRVHAQ